MKTWARYAIGVTVGLAVGAGSAVQAVRSGLSSGAIRNGPWTTGRDFGSIDASALTRARVALGGLLALPRAEAMYFNAANDSAGIPLDGRCRYRVSGGAIDGRWWSVTGYDPRGHLIANRDNAWSVGSAAFEGVGQWALAAGPRRELSDAQFISTGGLPRYELTLRVYHPGRPVLDRPEGIAPPTIKRVGGCLA